MASVSYSIEQTVDDRLTKFVKDFNRKNKIEGMEIESRTDAINYLLRKAGF